MNEQEPTTEAHNQTRYHVHGAACGPHRETGLEAATRRYLRLLLADPETTQHPWVTRASGEHLTDAEAHHIESARASDGAKTVAAEALHDHVLTVANLAREVGDSAEPARGGGYLVPADEMNELRAALREWTRLSEACLQTMNH